MPRKRKSPVRRDQLKKSDSKTVQKKKSKGQGKTQPLTKLEYAEMCRIAKILRDRCDDPEERYKHDRDYIMLVIGVNVGCRCRVLSELKVSDFRGGFVDFWEYKTGKDFGYEMHPDVYKEISDYVRRNHMTDDEYLFRASLEDYLPIVPKTIWKRTKDLAKMAGIEKNIGAHSLRKSYGRWIYDETGDIYKVMKLYDHASPRITETYICIGKDDTNKDRSAIANLPQ